MSIKDSLLGLAEQAINNVQNIALEQQFRSMVGQISNLPHCLAALHTQHHPFLFVYCSTMIKHIQSGSFCFVTQTRSEENIVNLIENNTKVNVYSQILGTLTQILSAQRPHYITSCMIDLMALCLKKILQENSCFVCLQGLINFFIPTYHLNENFSNNIESSGVYAATVLDELSTLNLTNFQQLLRVLTSMCEFVLQHNEGISYYEYRKYIYIFRNEYLAHLLQFSLDFFMNFISSNNSAAEHYLALLMPLLEAVWMYPFAMSLHESDIDEDIGEAITGAYGSDVYFPTYFRPILSNELVLNSFLNYLKFLLASGRPYQDIRQPLNSTIKILGRMCCASPFSFRTDQEKMSARNFAINLIRYLSCEFKFTDSYYLHAIMEIFSKIMTMGDKYLSEHKLILVEHINNFTNFVVANCQIIIEEGKRSPFAKAFDLILVTSEGIRERMDSMQSEQYNLQFQTILQCALSRIISNEADSIVKAFGYNLQAQIDCYSQLFNSMVQVVELNIDKNLQIMQELNLSQLCTGAIIIWFHFCSQLLPKTQGEALQIKIILKYYELAVQHTEILACLRYVRTLTQCILSEFLHGQPVTPLWIGLLQERDSLSFIRFITGAIGICEGNFKQGNIHIIRYSLQFFRMIFTSLKRAGDDNSFKDYYENVKKLVENIQSTVFANPKYYKVRRQFFGVIAVVWLNDYKIEFIYEIHRLLLAELENTQEGLLRYMLDMTGMIEQIDKHQCFEIVAELAIDQLTIMFQKTLNSTQQLNAFFSNQFHVTVLCNMIFAFISDINRKLYFTTHTSIPSEMHTLFKGLLTFMTQNVRPFPKNYIKIMEKMVTLDPLATLIDLSSALKQLKSNYPLSYESLLRLYFQHIQRVQNINWLYGVIEEHLEFMVSWWEEAIFRQTRPDINWKVIVDSRIWNTSRQLQTLAKLVFYLGEFDEKYWNIKGFHSEREFINDFVTKYA